MAVIEGGVSAQLQGVGPETFSPSHASLRPLSYSGLGHYRLSVRFALVNSQAANSRLFQLRNTGTNIIIPTRLTIKWIQTAAHTAAILDSLDVYKLTSITAVDTTNTVTPTATVKRSSGMGASPGNVAIRHVTVAGVAAGMTGGTLTKDSNVYASMHKWLLLAQPTAGVVDESVTDAIEEEGTTHPLVLLQNEGIGIENRVVLGVAAGSSVVVDMAYAEIPSTAY